MATEGAYPKDKNPSMKKIKDAVLGKTESKTTDNGPHLKEGKGTKYNQAKISGGFLVYDSRPGHKQEKNIDSEEHH